MHPLLRNTLALIGGVIVAFGLVASIEAVGQAVYPVPAGLDMAQPDQVRDYMHALPLGALLFVLAAWVMAAFIGGWLAAYLASSRPMLMAGAVGLIVLAATVANLVLLPHPRWFATLGVVGIVLATLAAGHLVRQHPPQPQPGG